MPTYYEDGNYIFVHAGIDTSKPMEKQDPYNLLWTRDDFIKSKIKYSKEVIFGHTPTMFINHEWEPAFIKNGVGIDTGCVFNGYLTCLVIDDGKKTEFLRVSGNENVEVIKID